MDRSSLCFPNMRLYLIQGTRIARTHRMIDWVQDGTV